ncbi:MAG: cation transporter [Propionibacteriaceae bacterium]|jgi:copper chaperone CopZ|nr:cation transporter [Propionibacteriaceae bacterium]
MVSNYTVKGMTCGHCVNAVKEEVGGIKGVDGVELDLGGDLKVTSATPIDFADITAAVSEAGDYTVQPA